MRATSTVSAGKSLGPCLRHGSLELSTGSREPGGLSHGLPDTERSVSAPVYQCVCMHMSLRVPVCVYTRICVYMCGHTLWAAGLGV